MAAIYVALGVAQWNSTSFGAPGLRFFHGISYLNLAFMTLLGLSFFSTSISEEKEEDTLGLMLMAGISPLGILIGKSGGRLAGIVADSRAVPIHVARHHDGRGDSSPGQRGLSRHGSLSGLSSGVRPALLDDWT